MNLDVLVQEPTQAESKSPAPTRTFTAGSLREALALVRRELGPDALIMGKRRVGHRVSVEVCLEPPDESAKTSTRTSRPRSQAAAAQRETRRETQHSQAGIAAYDATETTLPDATEQTRRSAASVVSHDADVEKNLLRELGYDAELVAQLPGLSEPAAFRRALTKRLNFAHKPMGSLGGCYRFVGASGVGKTSTLIKVLVEWVLRNNPNDVVVLTTDQEQLAGTEALQLTCQMLGVSIRECAPQQLAEQLSQCSHKSLVLIDTGAVSIKQRLGAVAGVKDIWVCSATHSEANLNAQYLSVQTAHPAGLVLTQVDQCANGDPVANLLYRWRIPVYWMGTGRQLPDGIAIADENSLFEQLFPIDQAVVLDVAI